MALEHVSGDLFELAPPGAYLAHACNGQGVWGAGIAAEFAVRYPGSLAEFQSWLKSRPKVPEPQRKAGSRYPAGDVFVSSEKVICMVCSVGYGSNKDTAAQIGASTDSCLWRLLGRQGLGVELLPRDSVVYSNRFCSGLFGVPWEQTLRMLRKILRSVRPDVRWVVCEK